jgi:anti-anti-sigma factor
MGGREGSVRARVGPTVVALPAEFNVANAWSVGMELDSVFVPGITTVIVDSTATTSCDSSGVTVLALAHGKAVANNAELRLVAPSAAVRHVLALAGLDRVLRIFLSMDEALTAAPMPERVADVDSPGNVRVPFKRYREQGGSQMARDTVEGLAEIEQIYERWVTAFSESSDFSPALVVPDPDRPVPGSFRIFTTGSAFLRFAGGLNGFCSSWPEGLGKEHAGLISAFFGVLRDWIATSGDRNSIQAEADVSWALHEHIKELAKGGFVIWARERHLLLTGGIDAKPLSWRIVDIKVQPAVPL